MTLQHIRDFDPELNDFNESFSRSAVNSFVRKKRAKNVDEIDTCLFDNFTNIFACNLVDNRGGQTFLLTGQTSLRYCIASRKND